MDYANKTCRNFSCFTKGFNGLFSFFPFVLFITFSLPVISPAETKTIASPGKEKAGKKKTSKKDLHKSKIVDDKNNKEGAAAEDSLKEAILHFEKGVEFFHDGDMDAALVEFLKAYELSSKWELLYNIGVCHKETGRTVEAHAKLRKYLEEGGEQIPSDRRSEVEKMIAKLGEKIGYLVLECNEVDAVFILDEFHEYKTPVKEAIAVTAGFHTILVEKLEFQQFKKKVAVTGGEKKVIKVTLKPVRTAVPAVEKEPVYKVEKVEKDAKKKQLRKPKRWLWAGLGAGLALGAGAAITGGLALKKKEDMKSAAGDCDNTTSSEHCPGAYTYRDQAKSLLIAADILWGTAAAAAAAGIILFIFDKPKPDKKESDKAVEKKYGNSGIAGFTVAPLGPPTDRSMLGLQTSIIFY